MLLLSNQDINASDIFGDDHVGRNQSFNHPKFGPIFGIRTYPVSNFVAYSADKQTFFKPSAPYYRNTVLPQEDIDIDKAYRQFDKLWRENHPDIACHFDNLMATTEPRIPLVTHSIWLTNLDAPVELKDEFIVWFKKSCSMNLVSVGWKHYLWVQDRTKLPKTVKELEKVGVEIKEVYGVLAEESDFYGLKSNFDQEVSDSKFGRASDILRVIFLYKFGGIYRDIDFEMTRPFTGLHLAYDFYAGIEGAYSCPCNAIYGSRPGHPVLSGLLEIFLRNYDPKTTPSYILTSLNVGGELLRTLCQTGPIALGVAVKKTILSHGVISFGLPIKDQPDGRRDRNIIFPSEVFFAYFNQGKNCDSFGWHAFTGSWLKNEFGSRG
ncbi:glycosyltransferase [Candidatus Finniella inopinata]|uniref:glycosyltransferase n=1 Tax=Candidatus Finniella inopinata TaxID=1696036 RepID=UPI0013EEC7C6|nr:glycosyltransferase [Candidatus Finniella inopinata]